MTDDLISRQAAIDTICKACSFEGDYHKCDGYPETSTWCDYLVALRALPSAQPEQRWIPVTERLPEKAQDVLVTVNDGAIYIETDYFTGAHFLKYWDDTIAWMPLPDPWKGEADAEVH